MQYFHFREWAPLSMDFHVERLSRDEWPGHSPPLHYLRIDSRFDLPEPKLWWLSSMVSVVCSAGCSGARRPVFITYWLWCVGSTQCILRLSTREDANSWICGLNQRTLGLSTRKDANGWMPRCLSASLFSFAFTFHKLQSSSPFT